MNAVSVKRKKYERILTEVNQGRSSGFSRIAEHYKRKGVNMVVHGGNIITRF